MSKKIKNLITQELTSKFKGVEGDVIQLACLNARLAQAVLDGARRERRIVLLPGEALFLRSGNDPTVLDEDSRRIMVVRRDSENADGQGDILLAPGSAGWHLKSAGPHV